MYCNFQLKYDIPEIAEGQGVQVLYSSYKTESLMLV